MTYIKRLFGITMFKIIKEILYYDNVCDLLILFGFKWFNLQFLILLFFFKFYL
jgi:hypothetical protein